MPRLTLSTPPWCRAVLVGLLLAVAALASAADKSPLVLSATNQPSQLAAGDRLRLPTAGPFYTALAPTATADRVLTLPNATTTLAGLGVAQTFTAAQTFSSTVTATGVGGIVVTDGTLVTNVYPANIQLVRGGATSYLDIAGVGGDFRIRTSNAGSLDTTALTISATGSASFVGSVSAASSLNAPFLAVDYGGAYTKPALRAETNANVSFVGFNSYYLTNEKKSRAGGSSQILTDVNNAYGYGYGTMLFQVSGNGAADSVIAYTDALRLSTSAVTVPISTASTSTTTGALVVTGGVGVGNNVTVAGYTSVVGGLFAQVDNADWSIKSAAHGPNILFHPNSGAGGVANRYGRLGWNDNSVAYTTTALIWDESGNVTIPVSLTVSPAGATNSVFTLTRGGSGQYCRVQFFDGTSTKYNWVAGAQINNDNDFEITPSTAAGGSTFSAPSAVFHAGSSAGQTRFSVYDHDNGGWERVTVGAADSGGVGFKALRIPN